MSACHISQEEAWYLLFIDLQITRFITITAPSLAKVGILKQCPQHLWVETYPICRSLAQLGSNMVPMSPGISQAHSALCYLTSDSLRELEEALDSGLNLFRV